jgi:Rps23 Pro-64 3,4-dihydroxylase Tpa1-like proline 4-hydroxylase
MGNEAPAAPAWEGGPELNPRLDHARLAETFRRAGRIHIPNLLTGASAARLFGALERETRWYAGTNQGSEIRTFLCTPEERARLLMAAWERTRSGFQYFYDYHPLSFNDSPYPDPNHYLAKLVAFLGAPHFLDFLRGVTGLNSIARMNATATLYRPGDFLTRHDDLRSEDNRLVAYVLNMTPVWQPDWGGALQFFDADDHIEEAYLPTFNALNLFRVPKWHSVGQVASFGGLRYSVTGWYHGPL